MYKADHKTFTNTTTHTMIKQFATYQYVKEYLKERHDTAKQLEQQTIKSDVQNHIRTIARTIAALNESINENNYQQFIPLAQYICNAMVKINL